MIARLFRRGADRRRPVEGLHAAIVAASRQPGLYTALQVPDTVEGRFEALCLHVYLVLRRLDRLPPPAADLAQELVDTVFASLDANVRELGVSDVGVGKRMKKIAAAFYGRARSYDAALDAPADGDAALRAALGRNLLAAATATDAAGLAAYVRAAASALADADLAAILAAGPPFPDPGAFAAARPTEERPA
ncbi:ubiquinol-cytochrome C chaperone family protein [Methylobacterium sp. J-076]|uniref:ubiquinol-cytochrome C chaperone family protein n=1 Tax=Methylobacterium sp. J-076 TaxID=2836655 RepID=UPI001FBBCE12|nr:ubiquinol-cytochrome C chaperone family protein [Methylobacterium sp. J-076]MCJ2011272.1 ubiquinol-cytochrome C chaperone [Methylobacterium sp. J-076]